MVLPCIAFATHLSVTHTGPCIQASLTLNLAQADSNFCLQITFQWLHKSASSSSYSSSFSSSSASFSLPLAILPQPPPLPSLSHALFCVIPHFAPFHTSLTLFCLCKLPPPPLFPLFPGSLCHPSSASPSLVFPFRFNPPPASLPCRSPLPPSPQLHALSK